LTTESIHTKIVDRKTVGVIEIIRENYYNYPKGRSNIYARNNKGRIVWYADLPLTEDIYSNPIQWDKGINKSRTTQDDFLTVSNDSFVVSSCNGYTVSIDYKRGKIIYSKLTK
jgi:hypothetical protein